ncbi:MAG: SH3-like domain-containing protein [Spirochaetales bacterium]|nr:SH3-like domain-containing protein [Spirochaetales bacterium]
MKVFSKFICVSTIIMLLCLLATCKKGDNTLNNIKNENNEAVVENQTQYVSDWSAVLYTSEADVGTDYKKLANDKFTILYFGSKVTVKSEKSINKKEYYKVQLPDTSEYWADKSQFSERFIVINKEHVSTYNQPDLDYVTAIKLEPGDFGIFKKEMNGWIQVDFYAYRSLKDGGDRKWVGTKWIQDGWTEDITCAKQAYYLYLATYNELQKNNKDKALEMLAKANEATDKAETEISYVLNEMFVRLTHTDNADDGQTEE